MEKMKSKLVLMILLTAFSYQLQAQNWNIPSNGSAVSGTYLGTYNTGAADLIIKNRGTDRMRFYSGGGISVGQPPATMTPNLDFEIYNQWIPLLGISSNINSTLSTFKLGIATGNGDLNNVSTVGDVVLAPRVGLSDLLIGGGMANTGGIRFTTYETSTDIERMTIHNNGKISIGVPSSFTMGYPGNYNLYVSGGIMTEKIKVAVKTTASWSDYVFDPEYKLLPLSDVEKFIIKHKHLPGLKSADEMVENGLDVAETNAKLLEKIEELTLYMIEMKKSNEQLQKKNQEMEERLLQLENSTK